MPTSSRFIVDVADAGCRLDRFLAIQLPQFSRVKLRRAITEGQVKVDHQTAKPSYRLNSQQEVTCTIEEEAAPGPIPEDIPLELLHDDDDIAVVNKPPRMVVHPSKGHWSGTLTAALAFHFKNLSSHGGPERPGIVHRLDRDTSGAIVVAKNDLAHLHLARQFEKRLVQKEYIAIVSPAPDRDRDWIERSIGVHPFQREKMAIRDDHPTVRSARTFYEVQRRWPGYGLLTVKPQTGRTHQIRVHLQHIGCPIIADKLYSGNSVARFSHSQPEVPRPHHATGRADQASPSSEPGSTLLIDRQALHAHRLILEHPTTGKSLEFVAPLPDDMERSIELLDRRFG